MDEDLEVREAAGQDAGRAGVVEVDVREEELPRLGLEPLEKRLDRRAWSRVDDHARPHLPRADHAVAAEMHGVDEVRHRVSLDSARST